MDQDNSTRKGYNVNDMSEVSGRGSVLSQIREGMAVYDSANRHIGKVDFVRFGTSGEMQQDLGKGPASVAPADDLKMRNDSFIDNLAEAFHPNDVPEVLQARLLQDGYIRLDAAGLFAADRFIVPDQIAGVTNDGVQLTVTRDELIKSR
jgi:hypothetical protein